MFCKPWQQKSACNGGHHKPKSVLKNKAEPQSTRNCVIISHPMASGKQKDVTCCTLFCVVDYSE